MAQRIMVGNGSLIVLKQVLFCQGCEISDEEAEKIFTVNDGVELLKTKLGIDH